MPTQYFPLELKLINSQLKQRVINDVLSRPSAYVEFFDIASNSIILAACASFSVTHSLSAIMEGFSCTLDLANVWNPRTTEYSGLFDIDINKRINIYYGQWIGGEIKYVRIFTGIPTERPESYSHTQSNRITLSGKSLAYLLSRIDGSFSTPNFTGWSKQLIEYWVDKSGIDTYQLTYTDTLPYEDRPIAYESALTGIHAARNLLGPLTDTYATTDGIFVMRDTPEFIQENVEFGYTDKNILDLSLSEDPDNVTTVASIVGDSPESSVTKFADQTLIDRYGENVLTKNNGLITSSGKANSLADDILAYGALHQNVINMKTMLNPYLVSASIIEVQSDFASLPQKIVKLESVTHSYSYGSDHTSSIQGLFE